MAGLGLFGQSRCALLITVASGDLVGAQIAWVPHVLPVGV